MGLLINQGHQKAEEPKQIIEANDVLCKISSVKLHPAIPAALLIGFKIIQPSMYKDKYFSDTINYDPSHIMAWKYTHLRKCAGVPYDKAESEKVDIEKLLLNKCLLVDLSKRLDKEGNAWQNCKYKPLKEMDSDASLERTSLKEVLETTTRVMDESSDWVDDDEELEG